MSVKISKPRKRLTREERHAQLLECAIVVAATKGLGQLVHADVAAEAGVGVANVFRYFPSHSDLLRSTVGEVGHYYRQQSDFHHANVKTPEDARESLQAHLADFEASFDTHAHYANVWLQWGASVQNECGIWNMFNEHNEYLVRTISRTLRKAQPEERRRAITKSRTRAQSVVGIAFALTMMKFSDSSDEAVQGFMDITLRDLLEL